MKFYLTQSWCLPAFCWAKFLFHFSGILQQYARATKGYHSFALLSKETLSSFPAFFSYDSSVEAPCSAESFRRIFCFAFGNFSNKSWLLWYQIRRVKLYIVEIPFTHESRCFTFIVAISVKIQTIKLSHDLLGVLFLSSLISILSRIHSKQKSPRNFRDVSVHSQSVSSVAKNYFCTIKS